jgi:hypothetical protein
MRRADTAGHRDPHDTLHSECSALKPVSRVWGSLHPLSIWVSSEQACTKICAVMQAPVFGDVNGDRVLEVVLGASSGALFVLSGISGRDVLPFPFMTHGSLMAQVTNKTMPHERGHGLSCADNKHPG